jgi:hypothetical protein
MGGASKVIQGSWPEKVLHTAFIQDHFRNNPGEVTTGNVDPLCKAHHCQLEAKIQDS